MVRGKQWSIEEERKLRDLVKSGLTVSAIARKMNKTIPAVSAKCERLGLVDDDSKISASSSSSLAPLPKALPTVEDALKILASALKKIVEPGLSKADIQRLRATGALARTYKDLLADYMDFRGLEEQLIKAEAKWRELVKDSKGPPSE